MEISGKITHVLEVRSGVSPRTGNEWKTQSFVIETHDQYPRRCVFEVFGDDRLREFNIQAGEELTVSFDIDAREYNGRWFNSIRAWRVERVAPGVVPGYAAPAPAAAPAPGMTTSGFPSAPAPAPAPDGGADDLPF